MTRGHPAPAISATVPSRASASVESGASGLETQPELSKAQPVRTTAGRIEEPVAGEAAYDARVWLAAAAAGLVVVGFAALAASGGVRGSDQYWYVANVETLLRDGADHTNTIFPVALLGPSPSIPPPFIHHILSLYLAALPALVFGGYGGWLALNLFATLATAVLVYLAARRVAARWAATLCAVLYPLLPVTFWHTTQPLAEASTSLFAALSIYLLAVAGSRTGRWIALVASLGLLYLSRQSFVLLLVGAPIAFLIVKLRDEGASGRALLSVVPVAAVAGVFAVFGAGFFGADQVVFSYGRMLHTAVPGSTDNMWFNFDLSPANLADRLPLDLGLALTKLGRHLLDQFVAFDNPVTAIFFWTFNILVGVGVVVLWRSRQRRLQRRVTLAALSFVVIHLLTIALFQDQARYTLPATPGLLVVLAIGLSELRPVARLLAPRPAAIVFGLTLLALVPMAGLAWSARSEGLKQASTRAVAAALLEAKVGHGDELMIGYSGTASDLLAYAARPRLVLYVSADYSAADLQRLRRAFQARWALVDEASSLPVNLDVSPAPVGEVTAFGSTWGLYRLP